MNRNPQAIRQTLMMLLTVSVGAAIASGYDIDWSTIDGGGETSSGGTYTVAGTVGQPDAHAQVVSGGTYTMVGGFWVPLPAGPSCNPDFDGDGDVDVNDFLTFSVCFNGALNPPTPICPDPDADLDGDGDVDVNDFLTFSACFNGALNPPAPACPCYGGS